MSSKKTKMVISYILREKENIVKYMNNNPKCPFHKSTYQKKSCTNEHTTFSLVENQYTPLDEVNVQNTAMNCQGIPYMIGHWSGINGDNIQYDSWFRTNDNIVRTKHRNQLKTRSTVGKFCARGIAEPVQESIIMKGHHHNKKYKYFVEDKSYVPYTFYYHYHNPQMVSPFNNPSGQDTRMELRRVISNRCQYK